MQGCEKKTRALREIECVGKASRAQKTLELSARISCSRKSLARRQGGSTRWVEYYGDVAAVSGFLGDPPPLQETQKQRRPHTPITAAMQDMGGKGSHTSFLTYRDNGGAVPLLTPEDQSRRGRHSSRAATPD